MIIEVNEVFEISKKTVLGPFYSDANYIECRYVHPELGEIPFTAMSNDPEELGRKIYNFILENYADKIKKTNRITNNELAGQARTHRNMLLTQTDWTQLPDVPEKTKQKWSRYRQELRDIPQQNGFPTQIIWPEQPN